jgi:NAD(P)-dependent dehydrogenase (short-subunit alcohol dehydrogenase family)
MTEPLIAPAARFDLTGKVAVVTGGTGALGAGMCWALAGAGARVVILARTVANTEALAAEIVAAGGAAHGIGADTLDMAALEAARGEVLERFGRVDVLVSAAGGNRPEATATPGARTFFELPTAALEDVFRLNFTGTVLAAQVFGAAMAAQGSGAIINISSMAALRPMTRVVGYAAAKAAVDNFTAWLAVYLAQQHGPGLRVNAIAPGFFLGDQNRYLLIDAASGELTARGAQIIGHTPMGRFGTPDDLSGALLWLASDAARFVTGVVVPVDGGFSAYSGV